MSTALIPFDEIKQLAQATARSGFYAGIDTPEKALVLMSVAQAEGCHPIQAMARYHVIKGKPCKQAWAMLADFTASGGKVEWIEHSEKRCAATFSHPQGGTVTVDWTLERARAAGLSGNDNWRKYPENMLHARCVSNGVKFTYPAAGNGLYTPEEVGDFSEERLGNAPAAAPQQATVWDQFKGPAVPAETPLGSTAPVDVEFEDVAMQAPPVALTMPGDDCDRVPEEITSKSRKLDGKPFAEMSRGELQATIAELERLAKGSKNNTNRAVITVVSTFARQALAALAVPQ